MYRDLQRVRLITQPVGEMGSLSTGIQRVPALLQPKDGTVI